MGRKLIGASVFASSFLLGCGEPAESGEDEGGGRAGTAGSTATGGSAATGGGSVGGSGGASGAAASGGSAGSVGGGPLGGFAGSAGSAGSGGSGAAQSCSGPAASMVSGTLTTYPNITPSIVPAGMTLETLNFTVTEDGDSRGPLLRMFAEVQNNSAQMECQFLPDVLLDFRELIGLVDTPPYHGTITTTTITDCLAPGETGVLMAVQRGISADDLDMASTLTIALNPNNLQEYTPAIDGPDLTAEVTQTADGWTLSGMLTPTTTIWNYGMTVYPRDARGVLVAELLAFPGDLDTLTARVPVPFETEAADCDFDDYLLFDSWIVGSEE